MDNPCLPYEQLIAFAAEELDALTSTAIINHLATCATCSKTVARFQAIHRLLGTDDTQAPPVATLTRAYQLFVPAAPSLASARHGLRNFFRQRRWNSSWAAVAFLGIFMLLGVNAMANVAQQAIPGDTLYPVKTTIEKVQIDLAPDTATKTQLHLSFAHERVQEISELTAQGKFEIIPSVTQDFEQQIQKATANLSTPSPENQRVEAALKAKDALSQYSAMLSNLADAVPDQVKPSIARAAIIAQDNQVVVQEILSQPPAQSAQPSQPAPTQATQNDATPTRGVLMPAIIPATAPPPSSPTPVPPPPTAALNPPVPTSVPPPPTNPPPPPPSPVPPTATSAPLPPTATSVPVPPTVTPLPPTATSAPVLPTVTETPMPPTATSVPVPPTATSAPVLPTATETPIPPTATSVPVLPIFTPAPWTPTSAPPIIAPTSTPMPTSSTSAPTQPAPTHYPLPTMTAVPESSVIVSTPAPPSAPIIVPPTATPTSP